MGTSNFALLNNASKYYTVLTDLEEGDTWSFDDLKTNVNERFTEVYGTNESDWKDNDRNYPAFGIVEFTKSYLFAGTNIHARFTIICTSGYYEGANLDYLIEIDTQSMYGVFDYEDVDNMDINDLEDSDLNEGMKVIQLPKIKSFIKRVVEAEKVKIDEILASLSDSYERVGGFSDGTSLYVASN